MIRGKKKSKSQTTPAVSHPAPPHKRDTDAFGEVIKVLLTKMDDYQQNNIKTQETHDGVYYQDNKRKKEQVIVLPKQIMVAKKTNTITVTIPNPNATPDELMREKPFIPSQKVRGALAGGKSQSEVSRLNKKKK